MGRVSSAAAAAYGSVSGATDITIAAAVDAAAALSLDNVTTTVGGAAAATVAADDVYVYVAGGRNRGQTVGVTERYSVPRR